MGSIEWAFAAVTIGGLFGAAGLLAVDKERFVAFLKRLWIIAIVAIVHWACSFFVMMIAASFAFAFMRNETITSIVKAVMLFWFFPYMLWSMAGLPSDRLIDYNWQMFLLNSVCWVTIMYLLWCSFRAVYRLAVRRS